MISFDWLYWLVNLWNYMCWHNVIVENAFKHSSVQETNVRWNICSVLSVFSKRSHSDTQSTLYYLNTTALLCYVYDIHECPVYIESFTQRSHILLCHVFFLLNVILYCSLFLQYVYAHGKYSISGCIWNSFEKWNCK